MIRWKHLRPLCNQRKMTAKPSGSPQAKVGHQKNAVSLRNELALVSLPCSVIGWEHPRGIRGIMALVQMQWNISKLRGWGLCLIKFPILGDLWGAFSQLPQYCMWHSSYPLSYHLLFLSQSIIIPYGLAGLYKDQAGELFVHLICITNRVFFNCSDSPS